MRALGLVLLVIAVLSASPVFAAEISGTLYDLDLNELPDAIAEIDTAPKQVRVAKNATYAFTVPKGTYTILARHDALGLKAEQRITVADEGAYVLDLILFPDLGEEAELLGENGELALAEQYLARPRIPWAWLAVIGIGVLLIVLAHFLGKKKPGDKEQQREKIPKPELDDILALIRKEGGRITQQELRKHIPYSEAKISLMLAELEAQGKIRKIKRGRGNIIILQ